MSEPNVGLVPRLLVPIRSRRLRAWVFGGYGLAVVGGLIVLVPFVWQALTAFKTYGESVQAPPVLWPATFRWDNFAHVLEQTPFARQFMNTVIVSVVQVTLVLLICSLAGYAFARLDFPGRRILFAALLSTLLIPGELFIIPRYQIMENLGRLNTLQALIVPELFGIVGVFLMRQFFLSLPKELDEAAVLDGCSPFQRYWRVFLPLARPGLVTVGILELLQVWHQLLWPLIVNTDPNKQTMAAGLASLRGIEHTNYAVLMAGALMAAIPMIVVFAVLQRKIIAGIATTGMRG